MSDNLFSEEAKIYLKVKIIVYIYTSFNRILDPY